jgi:hypothetical protein
MAIALRIALFFFERRSQVVVESVIFHVAAMITVDSGEVSSRETDLLPYPNCPTK